MYKVRFGKGIRIKAAAALMAVMMLVAGCGKAEENYEIDDYQNGDTVSQSKDGGSGEADGNSEGKDSSSNKVVALDRSGNIVNVDMGSVGALVQKLGGDPDERTLTYANDFMIGPYSANINVVYDALYAEETEMMSSHKIKLISEEDVKEEEIVKNIFGDTAKKLSGSLNESMGDSVELVNAYYQIRYSFTGSYGIEFNVETDADGELVEETAECPAAVDEEEYYIHTYEGLYNNHTYQLLIAYHRTRCCARIALFPKNLSEYAGQPGIGGVGYLYPIEGLFYLSNNENMEKLQTMDVERILSDRENKCNLSADTIKSEAKKFFKEKLGINTVENTFELPGGFSGSIYAMGSAMVTQSSDGTVTYSMGEDFPEESDGLVDLIIMPEDIDEKLTGAVKDGYLLQMNGKYNGLPVVAPGFDGSRMGYYNYNIGQPYIYLMNDEESKVAKNNFGSIWVDDSGVAGMDISIYYSIEEVMSEDVPLITFENAMKCFEKEVAENFDITQLGYTRNDNKQKIYFKEISLVSYMLPSPGDKYEYTFVPAWVINSVNGTSVQSTTLINAMDGSLIDIQY